MIGKWKLNKYGVWVPDDSTLFIEVTANNFKEALSFIRNGKNFYEYPAGCRALRFEDGAWTNETEKNYYPDNNFEDFKKKSLLIKELAEKYPIGTKVKTACKTSIDNSVYTIATHDFTIGNNNNIYVSAKGDNLGVALWMNNNYAEIIKDTKNETMKDSGNFKVGDKVYLDKQYTASDEFRNYSSTLKINTPYTVSHVGMHNIGCGLTQCIKLAEDEEYFQSASKFKLWSTKDVKSTDPFFDDALKAAKKVWPEFEWGCQMANKAGQTFIAIKPGQFTQYMKENWFAFLNGIHSTFYIDPDNTYGLNYNPSDLTVVSTKSAKERAEELMSSLPKSVAVKDQDIPEDIKKKLVERDLKSEIKHPHPNCQKYKVGDIVMYQGEACKIVNYTKDYYVLTYSRGWSGTEDHNKQLLLPGSLEPDVKYNVASDLNITGYASMEPTRSTPSPPPLPPSKPINFKIGDWVTITKSEKNWATEMNKNVGRTVQITGFRNYSHTSIIFNGADCWDWAEKDGHFRLATEAEIKAACTSQDSSKPLMLNGFKVGDVVKVVKSGSGLPGADVGKFVTITELNPNSYNGRPAARIAESLGNQRSGHYDRWIGLASFELVDLYQRPDDFFREQDYLKKPIKKDSSLIELKQEPHTITESLAEPMLLRYNKSKSKLISI